MSRGLRHLDLSISHIIQTEKSCGSDEDSKKSPLLWLSAEQEMSVFHPGYVISVHMQAWC